MLDVYRSNASFSAAVICAAGLFADAEALQRDGRHSTALALYTLAREELGKAFLIHLANVKAVPWSSQTWAAQRSHKCKQLLALLLSLMSPSASRSEGWGVNTLPTATLDAVHLIAHDYLLRTKREDWNIFDDEFESRVADVETGQQDFRKQSAIYVSVGKRGEVVTTPSTVTLQDCEEEASRARLAMECFETPLTAPRLLKLADLPRVEALFRILTGLVPAADILGKWLEVPT